MRPFTFLLTGLMLISAHLPAMAAPETNTLRLESGCNGVPAHKVARPQACNSPQSSILKPWLEGLLKALNTSQPAHKTAVNNTAGSLAPVSNQPPVPAYPSHKTARP